MKKYRNIILVFLLLFAYGTFAQKEVALTIDDLPFVGNAKGNPKKLKREERRYYMIIDTLRSYNVPAMGFVVAGAIEPGQMALLEQFKQDGNIIANHSYSHRALGSNATRFIKDLDKADKILAPLMSDPKYFRYPYLATGRGCKAYLAVRKYLKEHNYVIVPVTIDGKDFSLNYQLYAVPYSARKSRLPYFRQRYLNRVRNNIHKAERQTEKKAGRPVKQIFLIHMNLLNAYFLGDIIQLFRDEGYKFITVPEALEDPFYKTYEQRACTTKQEK